MIDVRVDKADCKVSMAGDLDTITVEFIMLVRAIYKGVKQKGEIPAQLFRESVADMIGLCFKEDEEIINGELERVQKLITGIEEFLAMFLKEWVK